MPKVLYHYTNSSGLLGMLESSKMWATNFRYLNDSSEISYGSQLLNEILDDLIKKEKDSVIISFIERCKATHNAYNSVLDCYIACMCEDDDLLSQWREYASKGGGFALGFDTQLLKLRMPNYPERGIKDFDLVKVIYDVQLQKNIIERIINEALSVVRHAQKNNPDMVQDSFIPAGCQFVRLNLAQYLSCFKHPCFSVEKEWRLIFWTQYHEGENVKIRDGTYGLTPYVELDIRAEVGPSINKLPLVMIKPGPTSDPANSEYALKLLLRSKGYSFHLDTSGSKLPVRKI